MYFKRSYHQVEWLKTAKPEPARIPLGTVVRLADGVESDGALTVGHLSSFPSYDSYGRFGAYITPAMHLVDASCMCK